MNRTELNRKDYQENTPLFIAIKLAPKNPGMFEVIKRMLQLGADPNIMDKNSWTPLDEAVNQVYKNIKNLNSYLYS